MTVCPNCGSKIRDYVVTCPKCHMPTGVAVSGASTIKLKTDRSLWKFILLNVVTLGIYELFCMTQLGEDLDVAASKADGKSTIPFWIIAVLQVLGFLIFPVIMLLVWYDKLCDRIEDELRRRGISYKFDAGTFWGWGIIGFFILVGPFIFYHKLFKAMNYIGADYNFRP